jgi:putative membrane protein insertion efficiency factor
MTARKASVTARLAAAPIRFYRRFLSPLKPPTCRFTPTCSAYALDAIAEHGALKGLGLALRRLGRCHPLTWLGGSSGFDPVPHSAPSSSTKCTHP